MPDADSLQRFVLSTSEQSQLETATALDSLAENDDALLAYADFLI